MIPYKNALCKALGWELLKFRSLIPPQAQFSILQKYLLDSSNHIYICETYTVKSQI